MDIVKLLLQGGKRFTCFYLFLQTIVALGLGYLVMFAGWQRGDHLSLFNWIGGTVLMAIPSVVVTCVPVLIVAIVLALAFGR